MTPSDLKAWKFFISRSMGSDLARSRLLKAADKKYKKGLYPDLTHPGWAKALCTARLMLGDFSNWTGWEFRSDYSATCWHEGNDRLGLPMWGGGHTKKLLILAEEGVGDEVLYLSLVPEALIRCQEVVVECDPRLEGIVRRSFPRTTTVARKGTLSNLRNYIESESGFTTWILMADLARFFRRDLSHFPRRPYLKACPSRVAEMARFAGQTGISWSGNHGRYEPNLFALATMGSSFELPVNLQYDEDSPFTVNPGIDLKNDLEGVFALCTVLSKVVSVSTSVAHIAGSVGTSVDVIHAPLGSGGKNDKDCLNWKWPEGKTPWYGSATVYRNLKQYEMR